MPSFGYLVVFTCVSIMYLTPSKIGWVRVYTRQFKTHSDPRPGLDWGLVAP